MRGGQAGGRAPSVPSSAVQARRLSGCSHSSRASHRHGPNVDPGRVGAGGQVDDLGGIGGGGGGRGAVLGAAARGQQQQLPAGGKAGAHSSSRWAGRAGPRHPGPLPAATDLLPPAPAPPPRGALVGRRHGQRDAHAGLGVGPGRAGAVVVREALAKGPGAGALVVDQRAARADCDVTVGQQNNLREQVHRPRLVQLRLHLLAVAAKLAAGARAGAGAERWSASADVPAPLPSLRRAAPCSPASQLTRSWDHTRCRWGCRCWRGPWDLPNSRPARCAARRPRSARDRRAACTCVRAGAGGSGEYGACGLRPAGAA